MQLHSLRNFAIAKSLPITGLAYRLDGADSLMFLKYTRLVVFLMLVVVPAKGLAAGFSLPLLYPSFATSWATTWIAKEAGYFNAEGLDVELIRVGGSTRMVAAMLGGSAPLIQAGASAALSAGSAGGNVVIIAATGNISPFHLMARPEIKQPSDLKGKKTGITTFGSTSDQVVRLALKQFGLEPIKDVALLPFGGQPEAFAALQSGAVQAAPLSYPIYAKAAKLGMRELVRISELGFEDINGTVITTKSFLSRQHDTGIRFMRAFIRGMHRYRTDKEYSKRVLGKYGKITDDELLEGAWQDYATTMLKVPRPSLKAIQFLIENQFKDKTPLPKPESFADTSLVDQLEKNGFIDSVNK